MNEFESQIPIALLATNFIEFLKNQSWFPFAKYGAKLLNILTAAVTALVTAGALHYTFDNDGTFSLGGNVFSVVHVLWTASVQYALQHFFFKTTVAPPAAPTLTKADMETKEREANGK